MVVPISNTGDLMLSERVVEACREGKFHVFAVDNIHDAIELMTGQMAGRPDDQGVYPADSLLAKAHNEIENFWRLTLASPLTLAQVQPAGGSDDDPPIVPKTNEGEET